MSIQQRLLEFLWRDHEAVRFLGPVSAHTAAEFLLPGGVVVSGWLYVNERGLVIIGDRFLADSTDDPATNSDRVSFWTWSALGAVDVRKGVHRRAREVGFERLAARVNVPDNVAADLVVLSQQFADAA